jgi:tetratricopeptide (TPR) repeat protein
MRPGARSPRSCSRARPGVSGSFYDDNVEPDRVTDDVARPARGAETAAILTDWVRGQGERPFFAFLHLFEPHSPYDPPEPFKSRFALPYDGEVARADEIVGRFLQDLKDRGVYDRALVVFLSDHGEGLNDHGEDEHGVLLYREAIHVPLMVKLPGGKRAGESVAAPVALTDVFPSVAEAVGLTAPPGLWGRSLLGKPEPRSVYSETLYPRIHLGWSDLASLVDARSHYIESPRPELYDIVADPGEKNDLAPGLPPAFRSLRIELSAMPRPLQAPGSSDPEQVKKLAALGYIGGSSADLGKKDLPAPRDRIGAVGSLKKGFGALQAGRFADAATAFSALLAKEPGMTDVWQMYSEACMRLGRDAEALSALQTAARLSPGNPQILMALSNYFLETGDFAQAKKHAELVGDAGTASPYEALARIAIAEGDLDAAERAARAALERYPQRRVPRLILGRVLHDRQDCAGALAELDAAARPRAAESVVALQNLQYLRGDCLARMGREAEAEAAFREERQQFPSNAAARVGLAMLYASQGREAEARQSLSDLVTEIHTPEAYFAAIRTYEILGDPGSAMELKAEVRRLYPTARERKGTG